MKFHSENVLKLVPIKIFLNLTIINDKGVTLCTLRFPVQHNAKIQMLRQ